MLVTAKHTPVDPKAIVYVPHCQERADADVKSEGACIRLSRGDRLQVLCRPSIPHGPGITGRLETTVPHARPLVGNALTSVASPRRSE